MIKLIIDNDGPYGGLVKSKDKTAFASTVIEIINDKEKRQRELADRAIVEVKQIDASNAQPTDISALIALLIALDVPQTDIAEELDISKTTIGRWLTMDAPPRPLSRETIVKKLTAMINRRAKRAA